MSFVVARFSEAGGSFMFLYLTEVHPTKFENLCGHHPVDEPMTTAYHYTILYQPDARYNPLPIDLNKSYTVVPRPPQSHPEHQHVDHLLHRKDRAPSTTLSTTFPAKFASWPSILERFEGSTSVPRACKSCPPPNVSSHPDSTRPRIEI